MTKRRWAGAVVGVVGLTLAACGSGGSDGSGAPLQAGGAAVTTTAVATTTSAGDTQTSSQVTGLPDDLDVRATDGPDLEATIKLLDQAVATIGPNRAGYYLGGEAFEVRVVEPTPEDEATVAALQERTTIPLKVVAVPMSTTWLEQTSQRLAAELANPAVSAGVDLQAGKLSVTVDHQTDPGLDEEAIAAQVHDLVATYLAEGQQQGAVAAGVTPEQAVDIVEGHFEQTG